MNLPILIIMLIFIGSLTHASELGWGFKSPAFHYGNGYSTHVLSVEQLQYNRREDRRKDAESAARAAERDGDNSILSKFMRNLESRIYATMSKQLVDAMFATCDADDTECVPPDGGSANIEGAEITWAKNSDTGEITIIVDSEDGYTEITIPGTGEFAF